MMMMMRKRKSIKEWREDGWNIRVSGEGAHNIIMTISSCIFILAFLHLTISAPLPANDHVSFWNMMTSSSSSQQDRDPSFDLLTNSLLPARSSSNNNKVRGNRHKLPSTSWSRARKNHVITNRVPTSLNELEMTSQLVTSSQSSSSSSSMQLGGNMIVLASVGFGKGETTFSSIIASVVGHNTREREIFRN